MAVFDTPINTDDNNLNKVLSQKLPVVLYLYEKADKTLDEALAHAAKENAGEILVARVDATQNPQTYGQYQRPALPALLTLDEGRVESRAGRVRPADIEDHVNFLLGQGPMPAETAAESEAREASGAAPFTVSDATFASDVLKSSVPVLVDFWAPWCGPCHMVAPVVERVAQKYAGRIKVGKLNVDDNPMTASTYQTRSIPTLIIFKDGLPAGRLVGAHPQSNIERLVEDALRA